MRSAASQACPPGGARCPPGGAEPVESADSTGPQCESAENSNETVVCLFGIIKSSPSGIHSGAGGVIHNWFGVVHFVRHLTGGSYFFY